MYRLLGTLEQAGMVRKRGSRFELGPKVLKLAGGFRAANQISLHAKSVLDELAEQVHTGVTLAVLDGDVVVTVETGNAVNGDYVLQPHELGRRIPATATSVGRMLLAFQEAELGGRRVDELDHRRAEHSASEQIRRRGYALTSGLLEDGRADDRRAGVRPGRHRRGRVWASWPHANRMSAEQLAGEHLVKLRAAADRLTQLAYFAPAH